MCSPVLLGCVSYVTYTDSQSAIHAIAQIQHHKQPKVTYILTTANKLHNQNDVDTSIRCMYGHCDIPGNDRSVKLAKLGTSETQHDEPVSCATSKKILQPKYRKIGHNSWDRGNIGRTYTSTNRLQSRQTLSTNYTGHECHMSPQNTPRTVERTPTSHQEITPSNVCPLPQR